MFLREVTLPYFFFDFLRTIMPNTIPFAGGNPIEIILAATPAGEIGYQNTLPWRLKGDLSRFRTMTMGNIVIMGKNTYGSLPKALDGRIVIVVSKSLINDANRPTMPTRPKDTYFVPDFSAALKIARDIYPDLRVFVAGGAKLYEGAFSFPCIVHLTTVYKKPEHGYDAKIENFNLKSFRLVDKVQPVFETCPETGLEIISHTYSTYVTNNHIMQIYG